MAAGVSEGDAWQFDPSVVCEIRMGRKKDIFAHHCILGGLAFSGGSEIFNK